MINTLFKLSFYISIYALKTCLELPQKSQLSDTIFFKMTLEQMLKTIVLLSGFGKLVYTVLQIKIFFQ